MRSLWSHPGTDCSYWIGVSPPLITAGKEAELKGAPRRRPARQLSEAEQPCNLRNISFHHVHHSPSSHGLWQRGEAEDDIGTHEVGRKMSYRTDKKLAYFKDNASAEGKSISGRRVGFVLSSMRCAWLYQSPPANLALPRPSQTLGRNPQETLSAYSRVCDD